MLVPPLQLRCPHLPWWISSRSAHTHIIHRCNSRHKLQARITCNARHHHPTDQPTNHMPLKYTGQIPWQVSEPYLHSFVFPHIMSTSLNVACFLFTMAFCRCNYGSETHHASAQSRSFQNTGLLSKCLSWGTDDITVCQKPPLSSLSALKK